MPKVTRPRPIDREGRKNPNIGEEGLPEVMSGHSPMDDALRKGRFGKGIAGKGPTTMPNEEEFVPEASDAGAVEKFGLGKGPYGAI